LKNFFKKFGITLIHVAAVGALFLDPAVTKAVSANPKYAGIGMLAWSAIMHWAQSPKHDS
jgi:hypothetical protein